MNISNTFGDTYTKPNRENLGKKRSGSKNPKDKKINM